MTGAHTEEPPRLAELSIQNFAIVDRLRIEWPGGFVAITGETGAGKSIIIDALGATLGDRFDSAWLRAGAERGAVEAIFWGLGERGAVGEALEELGCDAEDDQLLLTRDLQVARSVARVNGRAVPLAAVQQLSEHLVDVHSQASHLSLTRVPEHLSILDRYGRVGEPRVEMGEVVRAIRAIRREIDRLESGDRQAQREAALLRHEVDEIDAAAPHEGEEEDLTAQRSRLKNALRLRQLAMSVHDALQGGDEGTGALELLGNAVAEVDEIRGLDTSFPVESGPLIEALDAAEELARGVRRYADAIEEDPEALTEVEERLLLLADLKRKYGSTLAEVLAYRDEAAGRLDDVEHGAERIEALRAEEEVALGRAAATAGRISVLRQEAARALEAAVQSEMAALGMPGARFAVELKRRPDPRGLVVGEERELVAFDETGVDRVEFLMSANAGEPPRPLAHIASGGELARFMLALKGALSTVDETPVLVFDELDQGVGGRMGHVVGEKLWRLAREHQVLCITHLPQVAAYADAHFAVAKSVEEGRTVTRVERLSEDERVREIAQMLGGPTAGGGVIQTAKELIESAERWKASAEVERQHPG